MSWFAPCSSIPTYHDGDQELRALCAQLAEGSSKETLQMRSRFARSLLSKEHSTSFDVSSSSTSDPRELHSSSSPKRVKLEEDSFMSCEDGEEDLCSRVIELLETEQPLASILNSAIPPGIRCPLKPEHLLSFLTQLRKFESFPFMKAVLEAFVVPSLLSLDSLLSRGLYNALLEIFEECSALFASCVLCPLLRRSKIEVFEDLILSCLRTQETDMGGIIQRRLFPAYFSQPRTPKGLLMETLALDKGSLAIPECQDLLMDSLSIENTPPSCIKMGKFLLSLLKALPTVLRNGFLHRLKELISGHNSFLKKALANELSKKKEE